MWSLNKRHLSPCAVVGCFRRLSSFTNRKLAEFGSIAAYAQHEIYSLLSTRHLSPCAVVGCFRRLSSFTNRKLAEFGSIAAYAQHEIYSLLSTRHLSSCAVVGCFRRLSSFTNRKLAEFGSIAAYAQHEIYSLLSTRHLSPCAVVGCFLQLSSFTRTQIRRLSLFTRTQIRRLSLFTRCQIGIVLISLFSVSSHASAWYSEQALQVSASSRLQGEDALTSQVNALLLKTEYQADNWYLQFDGRLEYDAAYDLHNGYSDAAADDYRNRIWLEEAFIGWHWASIDWTAGYQKVVWGQADDLRVVDQINPLDLKDLVLFDIDEYRMALPMLRGTTLVGDWELEGLWIWQQQGHQIPPLGAEFGNLAGSLKNNDSQGQEFAFKASTAWWDADISLHWFNGYQDFALPVLKDEHAFLQIGAAEFELEYDRETMLAGSLSKPIQDIVVRAEVARFIDRKLAQQDFSLTEDNAWQGLIGLDYLSGNWLWTVQASDRRYDNYQRHYQTTKREAIYTASTEGNLFADTITLRFAVSHTDYAGSGQLYQSKLTYQPNDDWKLLFNVDLLDGGSTNFFGQFSDNDRVYGSVIYRF